MAVQRNTPLLTKKISWQEADKNFDRYPQVLSLEKVVSTIGTDELLQQSGDIVLLPTITPKTLGELISSDKKQVFEQEIASYKKGIGKIKDPEKRKAMLKQLEISKSKLVFDIPIANRNVIYNPNPLALFSNVVVDTYRTFFSLIKGEIHPKWMSGAVGIVQVIHYSWTIGIKEALFWLGVISLNLGIINLFPIPVPQAEMRF